MRWILALAALLAVGCRDLDCISGKLLDSCQGQVHEYCGGGGKGSFPSRQRRDCAAEGMICISPAEGVAGCVKEATPCDSSTYVDSCLDADHRLTCLPFGEQSYPVADLMNCSHMGQMKCLARGGQTDCVADDTPCDPATFTPRCLEQNGGLISCRPTLGGNYPVWVSPLDDESIARCDQPN